MPARPRAPSTDASLTAWAIARDHTKPSPRPRLVAGRYAAIESAAPPAAQVSNRPTMPAPTWLDPMRWARYRPVPRFFHRPNSLTRDATLPLPCQRNPPPAARPYGCHSYNLSGIRYVCRTRGPWPHPAQTAPAPFFAEWTLVPTKSDTPVKPAKTRTNYPRFRPMSDSGAIRHFSPSRTVVGHEKDTGGPRMQCPCPSERPIGRFIATN